MIDLPTLKRHIEENLRSTGGRPGLARATVRLKVPVTNEVFLQLLDLGSKTGATAAQVASVLVGFALDSLRTPMMPTSQPDATLKEKLRTIAAYIEDVAADLPDA